MPELTDALEAARERLPAPNTLEALLARIEAVIEAPVAPAPMSWPVALKIVLPLLGVAAAVVGAQRLVRHAATPLRSVATSASVSAKGGGNDNVESSAGSGSGSSERECPRAGQRRAGRRERRAACCREWTTAGGIGADPLGAREDREQSQGRRNATLRNCHTAQLPH